MTGGSEDEFFVCEGCGAELTGGTYLSVDILDRSVHVMDPGRPEQTRPGEVIRTVRVCDHDCRNDWWAESRYAGQRELGWNTMEVDRR